VRGPPPALRFCDAGLPIVRPRSGAGTTVKLAAHFARYGLCLAGLSLPSFGSANDGTQRR
jgi:hypothetical protein